MSGQARSAEGRPPGRRRRLPALLGLAFGVALLHAGLIDSVAGPTRAPRDGPGARPEPRVVAVQLAPATVPTPAPSLAPAPTTAAENPPADRATRVPALRTVSDHRPAGAAHAEAPAPRPRRPGSAPAEARQVAAAAAPVAGLAGGIEEPLSAARPVAEAHPDTLAEPAEPAEPAAAAAAEGAVTPADAGVDDPPLRLAAAASSADADGPGPSPAAAPSVQTYPTALPPPFRLGYDMRRGMLSGQGELSLQRSGAGYEARLEGRIAGFSILSWHSRGHVDPAGFAPDRFLDERRGRAPQAANFRRDAASGEAPRITYSGPSTVQPLPAGSQDRLSWMLQLAAIAQARPPRPGDTIEMYVSGARGDADVWTFRVASIDAVVTPAGRADALHLVRAPRAEHETRAEVWLDPARHHLPVRARISNRADGSDALELELRDIGPP